MISTYLRGSLPILLIASLLSYATLSAQTLPPDFSDALVLGGFTEPVGATWDANGRTYVWEKGGRVWIIENGIRLPNPLIDLSQEVGNWRDHGLLGFALHPNFTTNGFIYLLYVVDRHHLMNFGTPAYDPNASEFFNATIVRCTRYTAVAPSFNTVSVASRFILLGETPQTGAAILHESHGAGSLAFGTDGTLFATVGDGATYYSTDMGNAPDTYHGQALEDSIIRPEENVGALRAQMVNSHNGKILRMDAMTGDGVPGNPWYDPAQPRAPRSRVWGMGVRNAYRFTVRAGSGSTVPADASPGTLYLGDVGWNLWEELNICDRKGMNFGWPLFEGMNSNSYYMNVPTQNLDAPNQSFNGVNCTKQYYDFQDLIVQATPVHTNAHPDPCDPTTQIPNSIPKHIHARPAIDWRHGNQSRTGGYVGNVPVTYNLTDPNSPVPGPSFGGFAAIGGPVMEGLQLPIGYQGASFHGDYAMGFIRRFMFNEEDEPISVHDFASDLGAVTWIGGGPDGCIWYMRYNTNELRRICYDLAVDLPPVAVATQSVQYGPSPLQVSFTGSNSSDPGNGALTYLWDFGDDVTSTEADPVHTFTTGSGDPESFNVTLTVTDEGGQSASTTLLVSLNNTPPIAEITSFEDGLFYPVGVDTVVQLQAEVSDAEHSPSELTISWQTIFHHNTHTHPEPADTNVETSTMISGVGCDGEEYSYQILLTVTDAGGLSTTVEKWLYPACHLIGPTAVINASPVIGFAPLEVQFDGTASYDPGEIVSYQWDFGDNTVSNDPMPV
ncbi:MAG: PQQ-dependent sugar dehydrogenase, partial [Bacteroidota bacterium]|nr:PQQ-dependent sugar dehydrogenase [Bacteroidota bacterium]